MEYLRLTCVIFSVLLANFKGGNGNPVPGPVLRNCYEIHAAGYTQDGLYYIDPDTGGPTEKFYVYCDMTNGGVTHVRHDDMELTSVPNDPQALEVELEYNNDVDTEQIVALIESSDWCRQYIHLECKNVKIYDNDIALTYWFNRDEDARGNWGTATGVNGCQCRVDGDCGEGQSRCNCDNDDALVRSDSGWITDHNDLPITKLYIDEVDTDGEEASYRVSSLQCSGSVLDLYPSCNALKQAGLLLVDGEYLIDPDGIDTGLSPIVVRCDASTGNTVVVHSKPGSNNVPQGPGTPGYYVIDPTYANGLTPEQLALLVKTSEECWQWLSLKCKSARVFDDDGNPITWWIANDGTNQLNWASPEGVEGCGCSQDFEIDLSSLSVSQSSTETDGDAEHAIDGDANVCQSTENDDDLQWWAIDLGQEYCLSHVKITNTLTNNQRLTGAYVTVGNNPDYTKNAWCKDEPLASTDVNTPGGFVPIFCEQLTCGRYVAIILPDDILAMCEVRIFAVQRFPHKEIYLYGLEASQESVLLDGEAERAIDGNANPDFVEGESCILTKAEDGVAQWWAVEFDEYKCVSRVVIKNREDCCYNHLEGAIVRVGTEEVYSQNDQCGAAVTADQATAGAEVVFLCAQPICGTYLSIHQEVGDYLTFCEVQAYEPIPHDEAIPLAGLSVEQSTSKYEFEGTPTGIAGLDGGPELAIDGNDEPVYGTSCTHTAANQDEEAWWAVDLGEGNSQCIKRIVIKNRAGEYERLAGAEVRIGDSKNYEDNPQCGSDIEEEQATSAATVTVWCLPKRCGRYISIHQEEHGDKVLSLCEVWAFSWLPNPTLGICAEDEERCNCDANDDTDRMDLGYVREQSALPIQQVRVGDIVSSDDSAAVDIGPLVCEAAKIPLLRSCQELYVEGYHYSGQYQIDPDGPDGVEPFYVYCNMTEDTGGITCISHDKEDPAWVPEDADSAGEFTRDIAYGDVSVEQVEALIEVSVFCEQWVRLDCYNYEIWDDSGASHTWWMDRTLTRRENWGSAAGVAGCACSETNDCNNNEPRCNCDNNAASWNWDDGYISDKDWLPVRRVRTGGAGEAEKAWITVGPLKCSGINECEQGLDHCHPLAECADTDEGYTCTCLDGYEGDGKECEDIDECEEGTDNCHDDRSECHNTEGSFECECLDGYRGDGVTCNDIHECNEELDECHEYAECQNENGRYICVCNDGYEGDGFEECEDINECEDDEDQCDITAVCDNTIGGYNCLCPGGYTGAGTTTNPCADINECEEETDDCGPQGFCVNIQGSFGCQCNPGFTGNGKQCVDTNECADHLDNCDEYATCINIDGGFLCECLENYRGDGRTCVDINECAESRDDCSNYADCINTNGGYGCHCWEEYIGDGRQCEPPPTKAPPLLTTEAILGISIAGAGLLLLLLIICCCCFMFLARTPAAPATVAPPPAPIPQPFLEQPPPPPAYLEQPRGPPITYLAAPDTRGPPPVSYIAPPPRPSGSYALPFGRGNFNTNNSTDTPTTSKQVFYNPGFSGRRDAGKPE